jgi:hypothetical protein
MGIMTATQRALLSTDVASASTRNRCHSRRACAQSTKNGDLKSVALPASYHRRVLASSAVVAWAHRLTPHPRTPLLVRPAGLCCRDVAALRSAVWLGTCEHRANVWYLRIGGHPATGEDMFRPHSLEWGTERKCPVQW